MKNNLDSNSLESVINSVCYPCGVTANVLTCLKKFGSPPKQISFDASTYHAGRCDFCGKKADVTETRDFFYPNFQLINDYLGKEAK